MATLLAVITSLFGFDSTARYNCQVYPFLNLLHMRPCPDTLQSPGPDLLPIRDPRTACVVMSHHFGRDIVALRRVFRANYGYVGLIGPRRRKNMLLSELMNEGFQPDNISALHSPAGLDIGSESPEEIALAVVAEIQAALMGRKGGLLRDRGEPIHKVREPLICNEQR